MKAILRSALILLSLSAAAAPPELTSFLDQHCVDCHDCEVKKGGLDLTSLRFELADRASFDVWVKVHNAVAQGDMPPKTKDQS
jgi:hypothetical protein